MATNADMFHHPPGASLPPGPLFEAQATLPHLPVPPLPQTLDRYLESTAPFTTTPEQRALTSDAVASARSGKDAALFAKLQERLEARANGSDSWLSEWWNEDAYFGYRDPLVPNVNYFYHHQADRARPTNYARAAALLKGFLAFRRLVESGTLQPEKSKTGALCSASYQWLFNTSRLPRKPVDYAQKYDPSTHNHVVVLRNGKYFTFDLLDAAGNELSDKELQTQLQRVLAHPDAQTWETYPVGALTGANRDKWADARDALLASPQNVKAFETVQSAVIVLCLDSLAPVLTNDVAWELYFGQGARNRFFDKQELIVFENGVSGYNGEHSTMDGTPTLRMNDFVLAALEAGKIDLGSSNRSATELPEPQPVRFDITAAAQEAIRGALGDFDDVMRQHSLQVVQNFAYGKGLIKSCRTSPDAWVQMVIQLAYYKLAGRPCGTYESCQTRKYLLGRTEVIRSASSESKAFVEAVEDPSVSDEETVAKFQAAAKRHLTYASWASNAQGVDRHLYGLKKLLAPGEDLPALYKDPAFSAASTWILSTSQISSPRFTCWGFGEVTPAGFGVAYAIKEDSITFTIMSKGPNTQLFAHYLQQAALDIRNLHTRLAVKAAKAEKKNKA